MSKPDRLPAFSFAEIMVAAPWAARILTQLSDNDKGGMLQCNSAVDEWSANRAASDALTLQRAARTQRDRALGDALKRAAARVVAAVRSIAATRGQAPTQP